VEEGEGSRVKVLLDVGEGAHFPCLRHVVVAHNMPCVLTMCSINNKKSLVAMIHGLSRHHGSLGTNTNMSDNVMTHQCTKVA
jgi:hypothetical protein